MITHRVSDIYIIKSSI